MIGTKFSIKSVPALTQHNFPDEHFSSVFATQVLFLFPINYFHFPLWNHKWFFRRSNEFFIFSKSFVNLNEEMILIKKNSPFLWFYISILSWQRKALNWYNDRDVNIEPATNGMMIVRQKIRNINRIGVGCPVYRGVVVIVCVPESVCVYVSICWCVCLNSGVCVKIRWKKK